MVRQIFSLGLADINHINGLANMRQYACLVLNPINVYSSLIERWSSVRPHTYWRLWRKALIGGLVSDAYL